MSAPENQSAATPAADFTKTWRYKVGFTMIVVGNLGMLFAIAVLPFLGVGAGTVGVLVLGGEIISLTSIVFLGKEGFKAIKSKLFAFVKAGYAAPVGRTRHYIGFVMLCANALTTYILVVISWTSLDVDTPENVMSVTWGLNFAQQETLAFSLFLIGEISFLVGIYVMGADWWERFRRIVVWEAPES